MSSLSDLFLSYKQVEPEDIDEETEEIEPFTISPYLLARAKQIQQPTSQNPEETPETTIPAWQGWSEYKESTPELETAAAHTNSSNTNSSSALGRYTSKQQFTQELFKAYKRAGCSDSYAKMLVGQDGGESAWGKSIVGDFNYGNIKTGRSWKGRSRKAHDKREGSYDAYRSYDSLDEYVLGKLSLLSSRYHMTGNETPEQFADKLVAGGYATASNYKSALLNWIKSVKL